MELIKLENKIEYKYILIDNVLFMVRPDFKKYENKKWVEDIDMMFKYYSPSFMDFEDIDVKDLYKYL